jgi:hypothetical protein
MITTLTLAVLLAQDPQPAPKTVEDRVKELAEKIEALDKKSAALTQENAALQAKLEEAKRLREAMAKQAGTAWVKRYSPIAELTEKQSSEIEELWYGWSTQDFTKPCDAAGWKGREEALRAKLTPEQAPKIAAKVREDLKGTAKSIIQSLVLFSKLPADKKGVLEKAALPQLTYDERMLLPNAYPDILNPIPMVVTAIEGALPDLSASFTTEELEALRKTLKAWNPKR